MVMVIEKINMKRQSEAMMPMPYGTFKMVAYASEKQEQMPHFALVSQKMDPSQTVLVRIHSECITGDLFGSKRCDCGEQLDSSLEKVAKEGGVVIYLRQEGRGIGIINKLKAYNLQDKGLNTIDANTHLGLEVDARQYDIAIEILKDLGIFSIDLLTNNPEKIGAIEKSSIEIRKRVPLIIPAKRENYGYLKTKKEEMGHLLSIDADT
jgi:3,4-dihydroxy 2-butanone 4-phosphate synthase/GTP cyclohydrolase II